MITVFGHGDGQIPGYCGHEEIELALVKLARVTGENEVSRPRRSTSSTSAAREPHFFTEEAIRDGRRPAELPSRRPMNTARRTCRCANSSKVVGHAVRAMYLYSGMADIATEYNDDSLTAALETLWDDLTTKQMYITGGIGPAATNEGFTDYYDLPNESAYAETCASVGLVFWASRMLGPRPGPALCRHHGAGALQRRHAGLSLDGKTFFYDNPLESAGKHHRWNWHHCPCCPPNIARARHLDRLLHVRASSDDEIAVHLYGESTRALRTRNGAKVER